MFDALLDLVLPRRCVGCGGLGGALCWRCRPVGAPLFLAPGGVQVVAAAPYDAATRRALLAYKERGRRDLAAPLARLLAQSLDGMLAERAPPVLLVPVPSRPRAAAERGGDHVRRLARRAAPLVGVRVARGALTFTRAVSDSAGLDVAARAGNLAGALRAAPAPGGVAAVIVDDIVTTGATLGETARALRAAGWPVLGAAVVAATPRLHPPSGPVPRDPIGSAQGTGLA